MDKNFTVALLAVVLGLLLLPSTIAFRAQHHYNASDDILPAAYDAAKEVKLMYLVVQWPPAVCRFANCNAEVAGKEDAFTIHGLWPVGGPPKYSSIASDRCRPGTPFDIAKLASMEADLKVHWPALTSSTNDRRFWQHEWEKHGICGQPTQEEYFARGLTMVKDRVNTLKLLTDSHIQVGSDPKMGDVVDALKKQGVAPSVLCIKPKEGVTVPYVKEVFWCVNPQATQLINCPTPSKFPACPADADAVSLLAP